MRLATGWMGKGAYLPDPLPTYYLPLPVDRLTGKECYAFRWVGQSMRHCDGCGRPYWEHTHWETVRGNRWRRCVIPRAARELVRQQWDIRPR